MGMTASGCGWTLGNPGQVSLGNTNELYIYTWSNYVDDKLLQTFTAQTGIRVKADTFDSNETMLATIQAGKGAIYSIIYPSDYSVDKMIELKLLSDLDPTRLNGVENILPKFQNSAYDPSNRHSIPISWGTTGLIYNTEKLPVAPQDWNYLWQYQQRLARRLTLLNDVREVMGATLRSLGYSYNSTNAQEIKQAYDRLVTLKPAIASFTTDAWKDRILAGDLWVAMAYSSDAVQLINQNPTKPLAYVIPSSGTSLWSDTMVIPKNAPNPNGAYAWINFMLQPSVSSQVTQRLYFATPNQAAYDQLPAPLRDNKSLFPSDALLTKSERISPLEQKISEAYDRYWTKLTSG